MKSLEIKNQIKELQRVERIKQEMNEMSNKVGQIVNCQRCQNEFKVEVSWFTDYCQSCQAKNVEEAEKNREVENHGFWITSPNYSSMHWGSKKVKTWWMDEDNEEDGEELEIKDKLVKIDDNWFKMVKINSLPIWLERERERWINFLSLLTH